MTLHALSASSVAGAQKAAWCARHLPARWWINPPIVRVMRQESEFILDLRDNVQRILYFTGWYERRYLTELKRALRPGDVVLDVGAHIGIHSSVCAHRLRQLGSGGVIAFEASPEMVNHLHCLVTTNQLNNLQVVDRVLGATSELRSLYTDPDQFDRHDAAVLSFFGPGAAACQAQVVPLDQWVESNPLTRLDIVKIDVEGAELEVLKGMRDTLERYRPRLVGIEIRLHTCYPPNTANISHMVN